MGAILTNGTPRTAAAPAPSRLLMLGAVVSGGAFGTALAIIGAIAPKFREIFSDFGMPLSAGARLYIDAGTALSSGGPGVLVLVALLGAMAVGACVWATKRHAAVFGILVALALLGSACLIGLLMLATYPALAQLIESLQQQPRP